MGVTIIRDEITPFMKELKSSLSPDGMKKMLGKIQVQAIGDNIRTFTKEQYADDGGTVKDWDKFKDSTLFYVRKTVGVKVWRKRPSGQRYSASSKLVQDTGTTRNSIGSTGNRGINKTTSSYTEYGTAVSYAEGQNNRRPLLGVSSATWKKIYNIIFKFMGVTKS